MYLKRKLVRDLTIEELWSICPLRQNEVIAQCSRDCKLFGICHYLPNDEIFTQSLDVVALLSGEVSTLEDSGNLYDSHSIVIDHVENLTIIQGDNYGSN